ncbi:EAL domain-containing protein [Thalassotalea sp. LPB0316]|uniref:putative bifunctional diguanylate cyclase/phosphodiesterase n=1 Tax=Thalassotalea sp. LPB0316 TaxID=2769490 RepID=UPI0018683F96|nr:EAL domain-containing protein [Thalassotalea sp. LPB0316]QOL25732.1 EAL domain-containing protein [Thalassotalea sp. LPB0316]
MKDDAEFSSSVLAGRYKRLQQFIWLAQFVIAMVITSNYFAGVDVAETPILITAFIINFVSLACLYSKQFTLSSAILLLNGAFVITSLMFINNGLRDSAIVGLPGILVFAAIVGSSRLFYFVFAYVICFVIGLGYYDLELGHMREMAPINWSVVADIVVILLVIGLTVKQLVNELKRMTNRLTYEHQQATQSKEEIQRIAHHDALTGLPNRYLAQDRFQQSLAHVSRSGELVGLLFIDLDHFKPVNDNLGHDIGDMVLIEVAKRITAVVRKRDSVCRIGGDEFVVIIEANNSQSSVGDVATKILETLREPFYVSSHRIEISASIGVALAPNDGVEFEELSKKADLAMYKSKALGRDACSFFDEELNQELALKGQLVEQLRTAIVNKTLDLYFQPVIDLTRQKLISVEALVRWNNGVNLWIEPAVFIPLAEENGMIHEIGHRVLKESCIQCATWRKNGYPNLTVSVNLSAHQLRDNQLATNVLEILNITALPPQALTLEIKESALKSKHNQVAKQVNALKKLGVSICIDDYGYGHSNLIELYHMAVDSIKLDRRLVNEMEHNRDQQKLLDGLLSFAQYIGIDVIAKGIESESFLTRLKNKQCQFGQGFELCEPLSLDDLTLYLERNYR